MKLLIINGPSLNFLGIREKEVYGNKSYNDLNSTIIEFCKNKDINVQIKQSNHEGEIIDFLQEAYFDGIEGVIINPGAYAHYSYAIYDAIKSINIKCIEVHLTDITKREDFRKTLITAKACYKVFAGKGFDSYIDAIKEFI